MLKEETRNITVLFLFIQCIYLSFSSFYARHCSSPSAGMGRICYRNSSKQNRQKPDSTSEKWKWKLLSCVHSLWPQELYSPWNSPGQNTGVGSLYLLQGSNPGLKPRSPALQADSSPAESQGKPRNTRVGSLSILQWTFLTQELNLSLLHRRQILYQLSYQGLYVESKIGHKWTYVGNRNRHREQICGCQGGGNVGERIESLELADAN